jgi:hypothetical protein
MTHGNASMALNGTRVLIRFGAALYAMRRASTSCGSLPGSYQTDTAIRFFRTTVAPPCHYNH